MFSPGPWLLLYFILMRNNIFQLNSFFPEWDHGTKLAIFIRFIRTEASIVSFSTAVLKENH